LTRVSTGVVASAAVADGKAIEATTGVDTRRAGITRMTKFDELPQYLTAEEAAAWLATSKGLIYSMCASGQLESRRFGRLLRVPRSALNGQHGE
jgi:excisionase family DNA binding protein